MTITLLADVLRWSEPPEPRIAALEGHYAGALGQRLGELLAAICRTHPALGSELLDGLQATDDNALRAKLLAPETSRRLVTRLHTDEEVRAHLRGVFGSGPGPTTPAMLGFLGERIPVAADPADDGRLRSVLQHAQNAFSLVAQGCLPAAAFVRHVLRRLVLRSDASRDGFASNSPQGLVGLAVLTNAHLALVDDVVLAEALVHESIHGFVGMSEAIGLADPQAQGRWLADLRFYEGFSCTVSPWTGKALDLPTYLHACFVWWGLLHLWAILAGQGLFDERRVRSRLARAARGFVGQAHVQQLHPHSDALNPALLAAFNAMGREVNELVDATGLDALLGRMEAIVP